MDAHTHYHENRLLFYSMYVGYKTDADIKLRQVTNKMSSTRIETTKQNQKIEKILHFLSEFTPQTHCHPVTCYARKSSKSTITF